MPPNPILMGTLLSNEPNRRPIFPVKLWPDAYAARHALMQHAGVKRNRFHRWSHALYTLSVGFPDEHHQGGVPKDAWEAWAAYRVAPHGAPVARRNALHQHMRVVDVTCCTRCGLQKGHTYGTRSNTLQFVMAPWMDRFYECSKLPPCLGVTMEAPLGG